MPVHVCDLCVYNECVPGLGCVSDQVMKGRLRVLSLYWRGTVFPDLHKDRHPVNDMGW